METPEINDYLKRYEKKIRKEVFKRLGNPKKSNLFDKEDIVQETMIHLFHLLKDRYDPRISSPHTFIQTHLVYSIYKSIKLYVGNMGYTGKSNDQKRTGSKKIDDSSISLDFGAFDSVSSDQKTVHKHKNPHFHPDKSKLYLNVLYSYGNQAPSENDILEKIYCEQVIEEVSKRLIPKQLDIFQILVKDGSNPRFKTGMTVESKNISIGEIASMLGYKDKKAISRHIKVIREVVSEVIEELED